MSFLVADGDDCCRVYPFKHDWNIPRGEFVECVCPESADEADVVMGGAVLLLLERLLVCERFCRIWDALEEEGKGVACPVSLLGGDRRGGFAAGLRGQ